MSFRPPTATPCNIGILSSRLDTILRIEATRVSLEKKPTPVTFAEVDARLGPIWTTQMEEQLTELQQQFHQGSTNLRLDEGATSVQKSFMREAKSDSYNDSKEDGGKSPFNLTPFC